jgi:hypothetical protein
MCRKWREGLFREGFLVVPFSLLFSVEPTRSIICRNSIQNLRNANECPIDEFIMTKLLECAKPKLVQMSYRGTEAQIWRDSTGHRCYCRCAEIQMCRDAEMQVQVQSCRGAQMVRCRYAGAVMQRFKVQRYR